MSFFFAWPIAGLFYAFLDVDCTRPDLHGQADDFVALFAKEGRRPPPNRQPPDRPTATFFLAAIDLRIYHGVKSLVKGRFPSKKLVSSTNACYSIVKSRRAKGRSSSLPRLSSGDKMSIRRGFVVSAMLAAFFALLSPPLSPSRLAQ